MARYRVLIDDNFHFMDESHRYEHGVFDTADEAIAACRAIVDSDLEDNYTPSMSPAQLYLRYQHFGEDPFIVTIDHAAPDAKFSAWGLCQNAKRDHVHAKSGRPQMNLVTRLCRTACR